MQNEMYRPEAWGWKQETFASRAAIVEENPDARSFVPARITGKEHHRYEILCPDFSGRPGFECVPEICGRFGNARVSGRFEFEASGPADFPATGDWVLAELGGDAGTESPRIHRVLGRRSALSRGSAGPKCEEQVLAANIDTIFLVFALDGGRNFLQRLLERGLVVARNSGAAACVILNKADLASPDERNAAIEIAAGAAPNVPVIALSAKMGEGLDALQAMLSPGDTIGMLGKSGVGKSALINALGSLGMAGFAGTADVVAGSAAAVTKEGSVRADDLRGRHTTTSSHLYRLESGVLMIDSPGIRELKLWGDASGLEGGFPEIAELAGLCRFSDCTHTSEPGCAVQEALAGGTLDRQRFLSFLDLVREQAWIERRNDDRARREDEHKWKNISKFRKELKKNRE